ncbi:tRNA lysidine(34) synthetase TilS [Tunicatimonas pelagia]|uniref:tRNA lysidine(34) synthetase TilS n=1 Tax=Tunicatimonas pelagia TaxID=931531 RepID=UPI0026655786|nr:tRNA lysidine(34) synthetase TilS [Tunicatimonas pelagia]WKN42305.1 tRNA lysidine(34) synthetase TilS [Tunicatimonas pelagia]
MNSFQENFRKYNNEQRLFEPNDRILLSVSGGVDSSVLSYLFSQERCHWAIAHNNFQLRGEESVQDEVFVRELAEEYAVPFFSSSFNTQVFADSQKISTQMAARQLRREWFKYLAADEGFSYVALAHHHNDQLETMLLNLAKGGGIAGLRGMLPKVDIWIRPLLWATKEEILAYAEQNQLKWREDRSNAEDYYQRNQVRHHIIPALQKINPALLETTQTTFQRLREVEAIFQRDVEKIENEVITREDGAIFIRKDILKEHPQATSLLLEWVSPYGFTWNEAKQISDAVRRGSQSGKQFLSDGYCLWMDREQLIITVRDSAIEFFVQHPAEETTSTPFGQLQGKKVEVPDYPIKPDANVATLAYSKLQFPLQVRRWKPGDTFQPLGMKHHKKVSDFLIDSKVPRYQKEKVLVLLSGDEIVWLIGHRIDHRFRLTEPDAPIYEITWQAH